jgi:hypothetical protein
MTRAVWLIALLAVPGFAAGKKARAPAPQAAIKAQLVALFARQQDAIARCVLEAMPEGKWTVVVRAKVTLDSAGQLMALDLEVRPAAPKIAACVDGVIRALSFPKSGAPMVQFEREWTFSSS